MWLEFPSFDCPLRIDRSEDAASPLNRRPAIDNRQSSMGNPCQPPRSMTSYRVLVVTNLWPYEDDPSYGCFVKAQMESLRLLGVDYDLLYVNGRESRWNYLRAFPQFWHRLRHRRYDLIHAHQGLSGLVARCQISLPLVVSFMGDDVTGITRGSDHITLFGRFYQVSSFILARMASAVIVKTAEMKRRLKLNSVQVIANGVDMDLFRPIDQAEARRELGLDAQKKFVLFPYDPQDTRKRFDLVESAVARARQAIPELEILRVLGVPQSRMPLYMNAADVLVMASQFEGSPNAVKEAMATNLPVIGVEVGDTLELIGQTEGCHLVRREAAEVASKIVEVCRKGMRTRGRDSIARLSIENVANQIVQVYSTVVGHG
jgi:glycosyltransferase involved in cell wall biosynthesis